MIASSFILLFSLVLFVYWFRYTCILILRTEAEDKHARQMAVVNGLSFVEVKEKLRHAGDGLILEPLHKSLENDYRIVRFLIDHTAELGLQSMEQRLLTIDYQVMRVWYQVTRNASAPMAKMALQEMSSILEYFAQKMGERSASYSAI